MHFPFPLSITIFPFWDAGQRWGGLIRRFSLCFLGRDQKGGRSGRDSTGDDWGGRVENAEEAEEYHTRM